MTQQVTNYEYGFEIEDILKQFIALIDKALIMRYEKVENERRLVQTITPMYKFSTKNRVLLMTLNSTKNFVLPCVAIELTGIKADKQRLAAKNNSIIRYQYGILQGYNRPTPITITLKVSIITKLVTDLYQIYGKLATQFQPELFYSWAVPTNQGLHGIEELRNKIEWDFNISFDNREKLTENDEDRYIGTMNFDVQGWLFPSQRQCKGSPILDIGTSVLVSNELENRIDGLIDKANPLVSKWIKQNGQIYKNPRQFANAHVRILKCFKTSKNFNFRLTKNNNSFNLGKKQFLTFDGYNLSKAKALFVPKEKVKMKNLITFKFGENGKIWPCIEQQMEKSKTIKGLQLKVINQSDNLLSIQLPDINYVGDFDIILYDEIDYDTFYNAEGFYLNATK